MEVNHRLAANDSNIIYVLLFFFKYSYVHSL